MAIDNDMALMEINSFVEQNKENLRRVQSENPNLFSVVSDTLAFLNKKFGGENAPPIVMPEPEVKPTQKVGATPKQLYPILLDEPVLRVTKRNNYVTLEASPVGGSAYEFEEQLKQSGIDLTDIEFDSEYSLFSVRAEKEKIDKLVKYMNEVGMFVPDEPESVPFKEGDLFYISGFPKDIYKIWGIDAQGIVRITPTNAYKPENFTIEDAKRLVKDGDWVFISQQKEESEEKLPFEVGDFIINSVKQRLIVKDLSVKNNVVKIFNADTKKTLYLGISEIVEGINEGILKVEKSTTTPFTPLIGDVFVSVLKKEYIIVGSYPTKFKVMWWDKTQKTIDETFIDKKDMSDYFKDKSYQLVERGVDENDFIISQKEKAENEAQSSASPNIPLEVGDIIINSSNERLRIEEINSINNTLDVLNLNTDQKFTFDLDTIVTLIDRGSIKFEKSAPAPTPTTTLATELSVQERINELKDIIDGVKILADMGDQESIDELKRLKKELKDLKSAKK